MTKYVIIIPDGAADDPIEDFDGKTALEAADIPNIDRVCHMGRQGLVRTVPPSMEPGSDVAQMCLLGYDPSRYYSGRAPIEAVARNIQLGPDDWAFRCNLVTFADEQMVDHSAGHIPTKEASTLVKELNDKLGNDRIKFHTGVSYRHIAVFKNMDFDVQTCPPHDHIGALVEKLLPRGKGAELLIDLMARSQQIFANHDINKIRRDLEENPATSIWLWGQGKKAVMEPFKKRFGLSGAAITAVDLVRGLAKLIGFDVISVPGATGFVDTNYQGKAEAAIKALDDHDIVFVHIEAPDEAGHSQNPELKKLAIERIDEFIVGPILEALQGRDQWRILVMPDHPTPVETGAHSRDPVPFAMAGSGVKSIVQLPFSESSAAQTGFAIEKGFELMEYFLDS